MAPDTKPETKSVTETGKRQRHARESDGQRATEAATTEARKAQRRQRNAGRETRRRKQQQQQQQ
eukprot:2797305-Rhodomonas_salina.1